MDILLIKNGVVDNTICAESLARAQQFYPAHTCMERTPALAHVGPGHAWDGTNFTAPQVVDVKQPLSRLDFLRRFSMAKRIQIRTAAQTDPVIADAMAILDAAQEVRTDHPDTMMFVGYLQQQGLLTAEEAASILA